MKNAEQMCVELQIVFEELKKGEIKHQDAGELINAVGKMIGLAKIEIEYHTQRGVMPEMQFFKDKNEQD